MSLLIVKIFGPCVKVRSKKNRGRRRGEETGRPPPGPPPGDTRRTSNYALRSLRFPCPDPNFYFDTDSDPSFCSDVDSDPNFYFYADSEPYFYFDADWILISASMSIRIRIFYLMPIRI